MLSRTAAALYWMSRYLERAENLARMLDVSYSLSLMPHDGCGDGLDELALPLLITGTLDDYLTRHGQLHAERMLHFFALDAENPASLYCCLQAARADHQRLVRLVQGQHMQDVAVGVALRAHRARQVELPADHPLARAFLWSQAQVLDARAHLVVVVVGGVVADRESHTTSR